MQYEFAPLEGITGYIYRNAHHACFPSMDRYYTPFITPKKGKSVTTGEWKDIAAEHNQNIAVVPQILTNGAGGPKNTTMTLIMALNKHLFSKNYGFRGCLKRNYAAITGRLFSCDAAPQTQFFLSASCTSGI